MNGNSTKTETGKGGNSAEKKVVAPTAETKTVKNVKTEKSAPKAAKKPAEEQKPEIREPSKPKTQQLSFYEEMYKQVETGTDGIAVVLPMVESKSMKNLFVGQRKSYETMAIELKTKITEMGGNAEKPNIFEKMIMKGGTALSTMTDQSESKLAELVMKGVNMGIISLTRLLNCSEEKQVDIQYGNKLMSLYEKQIEALKTYL